MKNYIYLLLLLTAIYYQSCTSDNDKPFVLNSASDYKSDVAIDWVNLQRDLVKTTPGFSPPVAARAYAYAALALYETVRPGIRGNVSYSGLINAYTANGIPSLETEKNYNWELAANACMASILKNQFKSKATADSTISLLEQKYINNNNSSDILEKTRSIAFGKSVAEAIYNFSMTDGKDLAYVDNFPDYMLPNIPGVWEPTSPNNPECLQAYWGAVRPFLVANVDDNLITAYPPTTYSTDSKSVFYLQANEVYIIGSNLTLEQTIIAKYWSDDPGLTSTPPGHSMSIAGIVLKNESANLALAAEVFSKVGLAVHDAFVSCWKSKYLYNLVRPVTYIKKYIDPNYTTLLSTPPFPEHTSGHSVQTAAATAVLEEYFGYHYKLTDNTHESRTDINGTPRTFNSFAQMANETGISRLYGGIHFRPSIELGILQGGIVGRNIASIKLKK
ncbi:MAG: vanadium-dependent haloperoxidase [Saprospiraceae bacterium]